MVKVAGRGGLSDLAFVLTHSESAPQFSAKLWDAFPAGQAAETASQIIDSERDAPPNGAQKETASHFDVGLREKWTVTWLGLEFA